MSELLPCPHCGSERITVHIDKSWIPDWFLSRAACGKCGAMIDREGYPKSDAMERVIEAWNRRTNDGD